jgi:Family of unknown function (DUF6785)/Domain of unknown function (DUF6784)
MIRARDTEVTTTAPPRQPAEPRRGTRIRARALLVGTLLIPVAAYWAADQSVDVILSLMVPPVGLLLVVILLNAGLARLWPRQALGAAELVIVYSMLSVATAVAAEWTGNINPLISTYALFSSRNSKFGALVLPHVPSFLFFKDGAQLADYATGGYGFSYFLQRLPLWATPVLCWTALITLVLLAMLCINSLMREQWAERERLSFPLIQLPMAMTTGGPGFWRNRLMWAGFAGAASIDFLNGINFLYPAIPRFHVRFLGDLSLAFNSPPWNSIGWTPIGLFPFIAAIGVFLPTDLLFSCIFFFFFRKAQQVVAAFYGYPQGVFGGGGLVPSPPYFSEQSWGAFIGLFVMVIWVSRGYLKEVWREIWTGQRMSERGVHHRVSFAVLLLCLTLLTWFGVVIGLPAPMVAVYIGIFFVFSVALTRLRAQLGPPTHEMAFMGPTQLLVDFQGSQGIPVSEVARIVTTFHFMNRIHRTHPMPSELEALKMGERAQLDQRFLFVAILAAVILGSLSGHLVRIYRGYRWGAPFAGGDTANVINTLVNDPRQPNLAAMVAVGIGAAIVFGLSALRFQIPSFPLHPVGYALAMNFGVDYYWFGLIVALIIKLQVQRFAGLKGYEKLHAVALGIIMGEFTMETVWSTISMINRYATYSISINGRLGWNQ